jgi:hypothetical protein
MDFPGVGRIKGLGDTKVIPIDTRQLKNMDFPAFCVYHDGTDIEIISGC